MMQSTLQHLSEEELDDVLIGEGSREALAHLEACDDCRAKLDQFSMDIQQFNQASLAYSEDLASRRQPKPVPRGFRLPQPALGLLAAALVLVIAAAPRISHLFHTSETPATIASDQGDSQYEIAQDNELMKNVEAAIDPDEAAIVDQYELKHGPDVRYLEAQPKRGLK
jgi:Predicted transmembrane transcriptional regulator (anti-sigma factor)